MGKVSIFAFVSELRDDVIETSRRPKMPVMVAAVGSSGVSVTGILPSAPLRVRRAANRLQLPGGNASTSSTKLCGSRARRAISATLMFRMTSVTLDRWKFAMSFSTSSTLSRAGSEGGAILWTSCRAPPFGAEEMHLAVVGATPFGDQLPFTLGVALALALALALDELSGLCPRPGVGHMREVTAFSAPTGSAPTPCPTSTPTDTPDSAPRPDHR
ncbi:hypothetical protein GCM10009609_48160 [Pseudonocardia aurantiaca]|uniref:Uncharacterized protein n=1 Tax=Pseudonocardia aurantiaca TaxID=75290 RepID=A0ABW4FWK0_9PSEU